jgi:hypothetical protein
MGEKADDRRARLAEQLRANLKRRKGQARARSEGDADVTRADESGNAAEARGDNAADHNDG